MTFITLFRFTTMDPLAEKYCHLSPYAYCAGNPVRYVDSTGGNWYSYLDQNGDLKYDYFAGQLSPDELKNHRYTDLGYTYTDAENGIYYSLFGQIVPLKDNIGRMSLNAKLYQQIDQLLIKYYTSEDGYARESFYFGVKPGTYPFSYNGIDFSSRENGTMYRALNNTENSTLFIKQMPPKEERRFGGYMGAPSWMGCFMILSNSKRYDVIQINYSSTDAAKLHSAILKLFPRK